MKGLVQVIATPVVTPGFRLAGIGPVEADTPAECGHRLAEMVAEPGCVMILVEDRLYDALPPEHRQAPADRPVPLVVPFPGPVTAPGAAGFESRIAELLRQAIGYRVRLR
jgi:vacuolar-type H+-ATPase subunit F/Vma7